MTDGTTMSETPWPGIAGTTARLDEILELLRSEGTPRDAQSCANLLLTQLLSLIRPHPGKFGNPAAAGYYYPAKELGLGVHRVRRVADLLWDGIHDIERGDLRTAVRAFTNAREFWSRLESELREGGSGTR